MNTNTANGQTTMTTAPISELAQRIARTTQERRENGGATWLWFDAAGELLAERNPGDPNPGPREQTYLIVDVRRSRDELGIQRTLDAAADLAAHLPHLLPIERPVDDVVELWAEEEADGYELSPAAWLADEWTRNNAEDAADLARDLEKLANPIELEREGIALRQPLLDALAALGDEHDLPTEVRALCEQMNDWFHRYYWDHKGGKL